MGFSKAEQALTTNDFHNPKPLGGEDTGLATLEQKVFGEELGAQCTGQVKFSKLYSWLANGCLSVRKVYSTALAYKKQHKKDSSVGQFVNELIKRDFFKF